MWHDWERVLYVVYTFKAWEMDVTDCAEKVKEIERNFPIEAVIVDGAWKSAVAEMNRRHNLCLQPARKAGKEDHIRNLNDDFRMGRIRLLPGLNDGRPRPSREGQRGVKQGGTLSLREELLNLYWDEKLLAAPHYKHVVHRGSEDHAFDALLYLHVWAYDYVGAKPIPGPAMGSDDWYRQEQDRLWDEEIAIVQSRLPEPQPLQSSDDLDPFVDPESPLWRH
jgi:hypothetical protein